MAQKVILEIDVDESGAVKGINKVENELKDLKDESKKIGSESKGAFGFLEKASPRAASAIKGVTGNITSLASGFKTLRAAIISTGIGALVVALISLVSYFTKTKRGMELLERASAALGATMQVLVDRASKLGEFLVNAFQNPRQAIKDLGDAIIQNLQNRFEGILGQVAAVQKAFEGLIELDFDKITQGAKDFASATQEIITGIKTEDVVNFFKDIGEEIANDVTQMDKLTKASQRLRDIERQLSVEQAQRRADIKEFNKLAEDTTKTYQERIRAAEQASAIEEELLQRRLSAAAEQVRIIRSQNALSESTEEDLQRLADAEIELANVRQESLELQTTIQNKLNTIREQQRQEELRAEKALAEEQKKILEEVNKVREFLDSKRVKSEEEKINERYAILREQANGETELLKELEFQRQAELLAVKQEGLLAKEKAEKESAARQEAAEKELNTRKVEYAQSTASALVGIATALAGDSEANAKKIFAVNKALGIATATADTFRAANAVLADPTLVGFTRFAAMASVITTGLANVAKIAASKFQGGATSGGGGSRPSFSSGATAQAPQPTAAIDLGFLNQQTQNAIPAYVVATQVTGQQEANTRVKDLATL